MDFDKNKVDQVDLAAIALLKIDVAPELSAALDMGYALSDRAQNQNDRTDRHVVEAADAYTADLDDRSRSGSPEWEALSKSVDVAMGRNQSADEQSNKLGHAMASQAAARGGPQF